MPRRQGTLSPTRQVPARSHLSHPCMLIFVTPPTISTSNALLRSSLTLSAASSITCFTNPEGQPRKHIPIQELDYFKALESIIVADEALDMRKWEFDNGRGFKWPSGACNIGVGPLPSTRSTSAEFPAAAIAHVAAKIAKTCPSPGGTLGGFLLFGRQQELTVVLKSRASS